MAEPLTMEVCATCGLQLWECRDKRHKRRKRIEVVEVSRLEVAEALIEKWEMEVRDYAVEARAQPDAADEMYGKRDAYEWAAADLRAALHPEGRTDGLLD